MGAFIGLWLAQIVFGGIVFATNPKREDLSSKAQTSRTLAIFAGLVPCVGFMLLMQIGWLIMYRVMAARETSIHQRFQKGLVTSFETPGSGGSSGTRADPKPRSDNPFL